MIKFDIHKKLLSNKNSFELDVQFQVEEGQFVAIYGNSGAGKTSILKIIAGILKPGSGQIEVNGNEWFNSDKKINLSSQKRKIGYVFQDFALFPNMTVKQNLEFALEKNQDKSIIEELIEMMELVGFQEQKPDTLSGGQQQRVALARALVQQPEILLLDEPLSALDHEMRQKLQSYILKVHQKYKLITFLVSHDIQEVFRLSNQVIKIDNGKIVQTGTPEELFVENSISGKFNVLGTILSKQEADVVHIINVLSENTIIKVIVTEAESKNLSIGERIMVVSKAFNPVIVKV